MFALEFSQIWRTQRNILLHMFLYSIFYTWHILYLYNQKKYVYNQCKSFSSHNSFSYKYNKTYMLNCKINGTVHIFLKSFFILHIYSSQVCSPNCWQHITNTIIHFQKCTFPNLVPEGHTETIQLTFITQVLAWYIQYQHIYSTDIYSPNC